MYAPIIRSTGLSKAGSFRYHAAETDLGSIYVSESLRDKPGSRQRCLWSTEPGSEALYGFAASLSEAVKAGYLAIARSRQ